MSEQNKSKTRPPFVPHRFAQQLAKSGLYATNGSLLWAWSGTHWENLEDSTAERMAYAWLLDNEDADRANPANAKIVIKSATLYLPLLAAPALDKIIIPAVNGYIHIEGDGTCLRPHDKSLGFQHCIKCDYDPLADEPEMFNTFLEQILPDRSVRERVQEYIGYTFLSDARFQHAQLWLGNGANGKGALANVVQALHHKVAAVQLDSLDGFKLAGMVGAPLIYCDEAPQRGINEQIIKTLIAGELVQIDRKYRDPISLRISGKWLVLANHFPTVTDQSAGFWRRWDIVPFDISIPAANRDSQLAETIIRQELSGVLNWAIRGLMRLLARGRFAPEAPQAIQNALLEAKLDTNSVASWWEETSGELMPDARTPKPKLYTQYADWARASGMSPVASPKFWKRIVEVVGNELEFKKIRGERLCNVSLKSSC
ncbi:DNA primase family protein [Propionivibrio sp.]|uniref:DNA primase family protein n=1 Tax=Propionivibrio sp. TaxID=2212460 RepID=UPI003BF009A7